MKKQNVPWDWVKKRGTVGVTKKYRVKNISPLKVLIKQAVMAKLL